MEDSTSLAKQREVLVNTARARGWTLVGIENAWHIAHPETVVAAAMGGPGLWP